LVGDGEGAFEADEDIGEGAFTAPVPPDDFRSWKSPRPELGSVLPMHAMSTSRSRRDVCIGLVKVMGAVSEESLRTDAGKKRGVPGEPAAESRPPPVRVPRPWFLVFKKRF
jgi:hypothetical protein